MQNRETILNVQGIQKSFGPTVALDNVDLTVCRGEIHGLIGENGSGKSTLTSIIAGMQQADAGKMEFLGKPWEPSSMIVALKDGVGMIVQEKGTIAHITVAENIFLGESGRFTRFGMLNRAKMNQAANEVLRNFGESKISGSTNMDELDMQDAKLVEMAKVIGKNPELVIIDETTTALSQYGRDILYREMGRLKNEQKAVVFISHDLDEIMHVCTTLTVLRDGKIIRTFEKSEFDEEAIKASMIGRELKGDYYRSDYDGSHGDKVVLSVKELCLDNRLQDLSLELHEGEILGIGGLSHCGMHTLGKVMFGAEKPERGQVLVGDKPIQDEAHAMQNAIGYVSKDRDGESLSLNATIRDNISIAGFAKFQTHHGFLLSKREKRYVRKQVDDLSIKCFDIDQDVAQLSGGNKQKVAFGKWIGRDSQILILDCPTRGVDIGVKQAMYQLMYSMKKQGKSILMISEELAELIGMCDRIMIMKDGQMQAEYPRAEELGESELIRYMI